RGAGGLKDPRHIDMRVYQPSAGVDHDPAGGRADEIEHAVTGRTVAFVDDFPKKRHLVGGFMTRCRTTQEAHYARCMPGPWHDPGEWIDMAIAFAYRYRTTRRSRRAAYPPRGWSSRGE